MPKLSLVQVQYTRLEPPPYPPYLLSSQLKRQISGNASPQVANLIATYSSLSTIMCTITNLSYPWKRVRRALKIATSKSVRRAPDRSDTTFLLFNTLHFDLENWSLLCWLTSKSTMLGMLYLDAQCCIRINRK